MTASTAGSSRLCFFGLGALFRECYPQLVLALGRSPDLLCDNAPDKWGQRFFDTTCVSPADLPRFVDGLTVVVTVKNFEAVCAQLAGLGIADVFVACYDRGYNVVTGIARPPAVEHGVAHDAAGPVAIRGRWAMVTGASRGVGRQIAVALADHGANIVAHARTAGHLSEVLAECRSAGVAVAGVAADLAVDADVGRMLGEVAGLGVAIDVLVNNAGVACSAPPWTLGTADFAACLAVNTLAPIRLSQALVPGMVARGFGRVINVSSSIDGRPTEVGYACSKAALDKFVRDMSPSLRGTGVTMSLIDPGFVRTDMTNFDAPNAAESVIPGALLGALLGEEVNGRWLSAQDFAGLSIESAIGKARFLMGGGTTRGGVLSRG
jgi:3-oxoacyl-[acyl-carrier protein] reductase